MATNFPSSADSFTNPTSGDTLDNPPHDQQHANINDAMEAVQASLLDGAPLHIDDANERVGIGTASPGQALDVRGRIVASHTGNAFPLSVQSDQSTSGIILSDAGTTSNVVLRSSGDDFQVRTSNANRLTVNSSGNVGIGTTSPGAPLEVADATNALVRVNDSAGTKGADLNAKVWFQGSGVNSGVVGFNSTSSGTMLLGNEDGPLHLQTKSADNLLLRTNNSTRVTVDGSGNVGIGTTSPSSLLHVNGNLLLESDSTASGANAFIKTYASSSKRAIAIGGTSASTRRMMDFYNTNGVVGGVSTNGSATTFHTSSDYRLKENVVPVANASERLAVIPVHEFNFIADPDTTVTGFLAHELAEHIPEAVVGEKDEVDEEGNPLMQGIDQSKVVPLLTAALQEALTTINDLTARIEALEAG